MAKQQTKTLLSSHKVVALIAAAALLVSMMLVVFVLHEHERLNTLYSQEANDNMNNYYKAVRITHCYDNDIHPCVDSAIEAWNKTHPDDALRLAPPQL